MTPKRDDRSTFIRGFHFLEIKPCLCRTNMSLEMLQGSKRKNSLKENMKVFPSLCPGPLSPRNSSRNSFERGERREAIYTVAVKLELMGEILKGRKKRSHNEEERGKNPVWREREKTFFQGPSKVFPLISLQHPQHFFLFSCVSPVRKTSLLHFFYFRYRFDRASLFSDLF